MRADYARPMPPGPPSVGRQRLLLTAALVFALLLAGTFWALLSSPLPVEISEVRVTGDVASVRVTRPPVPATTMYLRKENGVWKVCAAARPDPAPSGSTSANPSASASPSR